MAQPVSPLAPWASGETPFDDPDTLFDDPNVLFDDNRPSASQRQCFVPAHGQERYDYITPDGYTFHLHDFGAVTLLQEQTSGMADIQYVTERGPFQDGETVKDIFLKPRVLQIMLRITGRNRADYWNNRALLNELLRPNRYNPALVGAGQIPSGSLRYYLPNGLVRQLDCYIQQGPQGQPRNLQQWDEWAVQEVMRFYSSDPRWYDPVQKSVGPAQRTQLVGPITGPIQASPSAAALTCVYSGNWKEYPSIKVVGPIDSLTLTNAATNESIALSKSVPAGSTLTIALTQFSKTASLQDGTSYMPYLSGDLATFHLEPNPAAVGGWNTINLNLQGATGASSVTITWYDRFIGI